MFLDLVLFFKKKRARIKGILYKIFFSNKKLIIGKNFSCDTFPELLIDKNSKIIIGDNVIFRRNVELRAHNTSILKIDNAAKIDRGVRLLSANNATLHIKEKTRIGLYSVFNGGDSITIGRKVLISGFVYIQTSMHNHLIGNNIQEQGYTHKPIIIHDDSWLGTHVVILPGVVLETGVIVGSNAVVTKSFGTNSIVAGVPAKIIRKR